MTTPQSTLWTDDVSKRFYLVPEGATLPGGPLRLRAGAARFQEVDPAAAARYEVSREKARAHLDARFGEYVDDVKQSLHAFFEKYRPPPAGEAAPGTTHFSTLPGVPKEALRDDPEGAARLQALAAEVDRAASQAGVRLRSLLDSLERLAKQKPGEGKGEE